MRLFGKKTYEGNPEDLVLCQAPENLPDISLYHLTPSVYPAQTIVSGYRHAEGAAGAEIHKRRPQGAFERLQ